MARVRAYGYRQRKAGEPRFQKIVKSESSAQEETQITSKEELREALKESPEEKLEEKREEIRHETEKAEEQVKEAPEVEPAETEAAERSEDPTDVGDFETEEDQAEELANQAREHSEEWQKDFVDGLKASRPELGALVEAKLNLQ